MSDSPLPSAPPGHKLLGDRSRNFSSFSVLSDDKNQHSYFQNVVERFTNLRNVIFQLEESYSTDEAIAKLADPNAVQTLLLDLCTLFEGLTAVQDEEEHLEVVKLDSLTKVIATTEGAQRQDSMGNEWRGDEVERFGAWETWAQVSTGAVTQEGSTESRVKSYFGKLSPLGKSLQNESLNPRDLAKTMGSLVDEVKGCLTFLDGLLDDQAQGKGEISVQDWMEHSAPDNSASTSDSEGGGAPIDKQSP